MALGSGLFSSKEKELVATAHITIGPDKTGAVETWTLAEERQETAYQTILQYLMYYARMMFFLSFRDAANELFEMMEHSVDALAAAGDGPAPHVAHGWTLSAESVTDGPVYSSELFRMGPSGYKCKSAKPAEPEDIDVQGSVLLYLEHLVSTLPVLERAYLALALKGMAEYYEHGKHWHTTKSLHPAPAYGMNYARRILEQPGPSR
ncbi:MAG: hypothetical protein Q7J82_02885 [Coriobacteriia bacterium]|nr:hypothetical protein [Coriobacteriia bacterium]